MTYSFIAMDAATVVYCFQIFQLAKFVKKSAKKYVYAAFFAPLTLSFDSVELLGNGEDIKNVW